MGNDAAAEDAVALGIDGADPGAVLVGDPDPVAAKGDRAGAAADVDPLDDLARPGVDPQDLSREG